MKIFLLFYMCHFAVGLTHCYKTTVFFYILYNRDVTFLVILLFSRSRAQVKPSHRFLRWMAQITCFRPRKCLLGVRTMGDVIWGKYPPKRGVNGQFQAKTPQFYTAISLELLIRRTSDLRSEFRPRKALCGWSAITPKNTTWLTATILKIDMTSYFSGGCSDLDEIR